MRRRILIMGAAGRDFHNFNVCYRNNPECEVVAFTASQIPNIEGRTYPASLAGPSYPEGVPIYPESELEDLIAKLGVHEVVFAYSDVPHREVMHKASIVLAAGADFKLIGPRATQIRARVPVVSVCATRTGAGKSPATRRIAEALKELGYDPVVIRHPMPYGDLAAERVQRFGTMDDLDRQNCTIEEREEYEPHLTRGVVVYAGVDYEAILHEAEREADIILWDGGNNDFSFYASDLLVVVTDPHRAGHELTYHPGETNLRMADVVIVSKVDTAARGAVETVRENVQATNPGAIVIEAESPIAVDNPDAILGKTVLAVEDGPTVTHGEMPYGAAFVAARRYGARIVDPRPYVCGSIAEIYRKYPTIGTVLPAMGYSAHQIHDLEQTIARTPCDLVLTATPIDLRRVIRISQPIQRVRYGLREIGPVSLSDVMRRKFGVRGEGGKERRTAEPALA